MAVISCLSFTWTITWFWFGKRSFPRASLKEKIDQSPACWVFYDFQNAKYERIWTLCPDYNLTWTACASDFMLSSRCHSLSVPVCHSGMSKLESDHHSRFVSPPLSNSWTGFWLSLFLKETKKCLLSAHPVVGALRMKLPGLHGLLLAKIKACSDLQEGFGAVTITLWKIWYNSKQLLKSNLSKFIVENRIILE